MVNAVVCVGIAANDDGDTLLMFKNLKADVLINCEWSHRGFVTPVNPV